MTDRELLQQAVYKITELRRENTDDATYVIEDAIWNRLSQCDRCGEVSPAEIHTCTPKQQEPVIGTKTWFQDGEIITQDLHPSDVYLDPPQRKWQGLTRKQLLQIWGKPENFNDPMRFARAIEAKLKEKNT